MKEIYYSLDEYGEKAQSFTWLISNRRDAVSSGFQSGLSDPASLMAPNESEFTFWLQFIDTLMSV